MDTRMPRQHRDVSFRRPPESIMVAPRSLAILVAFTLGGVLLLVLLSAIRGVLAQLLAAVVLAIALEPLIEGLQRRGLARTPAVILTFVLFLIAAAGFVFALVPPLAEGFPRLLHEGPALLDRLHQIGPVAALEQRFGIVDSARTWWSEHGGTRLIGAPTLRFAKGFLDTGSDVATVSFLALFLLLSGREWFDSLLEMIPSESSRALWHRVGAGVTKAVGGYVFGNVLISIIAGTVATLVCLVVGVPYALPLGLVVAVFDFIPMVGATLATVIVALVALTRGVAASVIVVAALLVYQLIENHVLTQAVYHGTVKLSMITIAVSLAIGAELGGVAGALMAIPIAGALKVALVEVLASRQGRTARSGV